MLGNLILISAASGTGKTSLVKRLVQEVDDLLISVSYTTRPQRSQEVNNKAYCFVNEQQFKAMQVAGDFIETAKVFDYYYGTPKQWLVTQLEQGKDVICEIDWQGAQLVKEQFPHALGIFILPPSLDVLKQRLYDRGREDTQHIQRRLKEASFEMSHYKAYQYLVINQSFDIALAQLKAIIVAQRLLVSRQAEVNQALIQSLVP